MGSLRAQFCYKSSQFAGQIFGLTSIFPYFFSFQTSSLQTSSPEEGTHEIFIDPPSSPPPTQEELESELSYEGEEEAPNHDKVRDAVLSSIYLMEEGVDLQLQGLEDFQHGLRRLKNSVRKTPLAVLIPAIRSASGWGSSRLDRILAEPGTIRKRKASSIFSSDDEDEYVPRSPKYNPEGESDSASSTL